MWAEPRGARVHTLQLAYATGVMTVSMVMRVGAVALCWHHLRLIVCSWQAEQECYREQQTITRIRQIWVAKLDEVFIRNKLRTG